MPTKNATADEIRKRPIYITLPGTTLRLECRRPNPLELIASGLLKLDAFGSVIEQISATLQEIQAEASLDNRPFDPTLDKPKTYAEFVDYWCVAAVVAPRVVLKEEDAIYDPTALWIGELDWDVKTEIYAKTMGVLASSRVLNAVRSFRLRRSDGARTGSDREAVREEPVGAAPGV